MDLTRLAFFCIIGTTEFTRVGRAWSADTETVISLLSLLTESPAETVHLDRSHGSQTLTLTARRFGGLPINPVALEWDETHLHVTAGRVTRSYQIETSLAAWLTELSGRSRGD